MRLGYSLALFIGVRCVVSCSGQEVGLPESGRFEVASVRMTPADQTGLASLSPPNSNRFTANKVPLKLLVEMAFGVSDTEVSDPGNLLGSARYDIAAKATGEGVLTYDKLKPLLSALLAERFDLAAHYQIKTVAGYALVIAKGGPKLKTTDGVKGNVIWPGGIQGAQISLDALASMLAKPLGRPVLNRTDLEGKFDIRLEYDPVAVEDSPSSSSRPSLFVALQEQLGLKVESAKVDSTVLVIDRCNKTPADNCAQRLAFVSSCPGLR